MLSRYLVSQVKHNSYFLCGLLFGLWVALVAVPFDEEGPAGACVTSPSGASLAGDDEFAPVHETRPPGPGGAAAGAGVARSVQRPRYYSTELGMRGALLAGVLTGAGGSEHFMTAINQTAAALLPALRFFITASTPPSEATLPRANVVGFTDTREMLKPFHTLKYLADTYLEEYNFFFLVTDTAFINAPQLKELVSKLSVSQDVYMGVPADDDSHYCSLDSGILLSNSVLRAMYGSLDWCVRNSYSPHHHENIGRCVLHAAHVSCTSQIQGARYEAVRVGEDGGSTPPLEPRSARAAVTSPLASPADLHLLHAYVARMRLEEAREAQARAAGAMRLARRRGPAHADVAGTRWPAGVRRDPGHAPPPPDSRFDLPRWSLLNATHALFADDLRAATPHTGAHREALQLVLEAAVAWLRARSPHAADATGGADLATDEDEVATAEAPPPPRLVEGARCWEPALGLRYRLLIEYHGSLRLVEVMRVVGAARLVSVPYVTESARLTLVLPVAPRSSVASVTPGVASVTPGVASGGTAAWLRARRATDNTDVIVVLIHPAAANASGSQELEDIRTAIAELRDATVRVVDVQEPTSEPARPLRPISERAQLLAMQAALQLVRKDALLLAVAEDLEFNDEFLNRVRMNTIPGAQWFAPVPFARHAQYNHPRFSALTNTGRFAEGGASLTPGREGGAGRAPVLAVAARDLTAALTESPACVSVAEVLTRWGLRCVRAPEPGLVASPPPAPCGAPRPPADPQASPPVDQCLREVRARGLDNIHLGAKHALAKLILETIDGVTS